MNPNQYLPVGGNIEFVISSDSSSESEPVLEIIPNPNQKAIDFFKNEEFSLSLQRDQLNLKFKKYKKILKDLKQQKHQLKGKLNDERHK